MTTLRFRPPLPHPDAFNVIRPPSQPVEYDEATGEYVFTFDPDLTAEEQAALDGLVSLGRSAVQITPAEWQALLPTLIGLRDYHALTAPTGVQTVAAVKGIIRVLRAILRD